MSSTDAAARRAAVLREFGRQAGTFEDRRLNSAFTVHLERLVDFARPGAADVCLDAACGTGLVARALAARTRHVNALDSTPEMLAVGKERADAEGIANVVFERGDAAALPHLDDSFSLVVSRFSLHHVVSPAGVTAELVRVCRPGGRVVVADMVTDPAAPGDADRMERLRDPSHGSMPTAEGIAELLEAAGAAVRRTDVFDVSRPLRQWLEQARTPADAAARIERELGAELDGGPATGLRPHLVDGALFFTQTWAHVAAEPR
ncbi:SAM-dependent methyltransferase [Spinactinospora alkalitolerans]|uniref:SAM-dependent methyltransferase n=1 Tax=Spinactinospora alkalitolerans TaxID=687207 RepID=A0A852TVY2_9ACTN|nr:methyltransferase domain-containing protein [Spinactinospora alkalitolerans]NYE47003.1 SAM-dependent methyltransferase [Spinactinospora alkalitolerans]